METNFGGFEAPGNWYRGNLHLHTKRSDGSHSPEDTVQFYQDSGYDFVAITDHTPLLGEGAVPPHPAETLSREGFLVLHGAEYAWNPNGETVHVVVVGAGYGIQPTPDPDPSDWLRKWWDADGFSWYAHPYWSNNSTDALERMSFLPGVEIWNFVCEMGANKGLSAPYVDRLLARQKHHCILAVDDCHDLYKHSRGGWVMVKAQELSQAAIIAALRRGDFYASSGPTIEAITAESGRLIVRSSPVRVAKLIMKNGGGQRIEFPRGSTFTDAEFMFDCQNLGADQPYLRVEVEDEWGRCAWSQAVSTR